MNTFLQGFASELVKVAFKAPGQPPDPPSTAPTPVGGSPYRPTVANTPKPPNAVAPGKAWASKIPTQKLESPAGPPKGTGWRPQRGYRPKPASDPAAPAPKKVGRGSSSKAGPSFVPYESGKTYLNRTRKEESYNANLAKQKTEKAMQSKMDAARPAWNKQQASTKTNQNPVTGQRTSVPSASTVSPPVEQRFRANAAKNKKNDIFARYRNTGFLKRQPLTVTDTSAKGTKKTYSTGDDQRNVAGTASRVLGKVF